MYKINKEKFNEIISLYPIWKELNERIKALYPRGVNFHEAFSEIIVCYVNDYFHSIKAGSEDALTNDMLKVQIKGTSNFDSDLTSFGPNSEFEILEFARLNQFYDRLYLYRIPINNLYNIQVNCNQTFKDQQLEHRRPRLSIITNYINKFSIEPYAVVDMLNGEIIYL
ncbi:hypothetical protein ACF3OF_00615 [Sneathia vaginalis]|uniref:hypothetical protein n=1 Tax=Sneathia vaginalis TaxID=187101 RepID=UPI00370DD22A